MEINKNTKKQIYTIIIFAIVLFWTLQNYTIILSLLRFLLGLVSPFIIGGAIAFILNIPMNLIENRLLKKAKLNAKLKRGLCLVLSILLVFFIIFVVMFMIIPEIGNTFMLLNDKLPEAWEKAQKWVGVQFKNYPALTKIFSQNNINWDEITGFVVDFLKNGAANLISSTATIAASIFSGLITFILAFIFAIYVLTQKEGLASNAKKAMYAYLKENTADSLISIGRLVNKTFTNYFSGQCLDAVILGILCFIGMTIFKFDYALMVSAFIAFTALIPMFGGFIGCALGIFLLLINNPIDALYFTIFFVILQQIDGNLIYPRVVGNSIGLPPIWVLVAFTLGGSLMGVVGMIIFIPLFSVFYALFKEITNRRLDKNKIEKSKYT